MLNILHKLKNKIICKHRAAWSLAFARVREYLSTRDYSRCPGRARTNACGYTSAFSRAYARARSNVSNLSHPRAHARVCDRAYDRAFFHPTCTPNFTRTRKYARVRANACFPGYLRSACALIFALTLTLSVAALFPAPAAALLAPPGSAPPAPPPLPTFAAGGYHSLVVKADGTTWSWGRGGALGDGSTRDEIRLEPMQARGLTGITAVDGSSGHSAARTTDSQAWTWGSGLQGALGHGDASRRPYPEKVQTFHGVMDVATGNGFTLALLANGTVWAWGDNSEGQLGDGTRENRFAPVPVQGLHSIRAISAGSYHAVALRADGTVWAWGLVLLEEAFRTETPLQAPGLTRAVAIAAGGEHTLTLQADGTVWSWGRGTYGQLGRGTITTARTPLQVKGLSQITAVSAGDSHSLALGADGTVWAWGYNQQGQLGTGTATEAFPFGETIPRQVQGLEHLQITALSAGGFAGSVFSLAAAPRQEIILQIGTPEAQIGTIDLYAWGDNDYGQLGEGTRDLQPLPVQLPLDLTTTATLDVAPFIEADRTLVPLRFLGEALGARFHWDGEERRVTFTRDDREIILWIDQHQALINGRQVELDVPPRILRSRTVVPLRFVGETLGADFLWEEETRRITITPALSPPAP